MLMPSSRSASIAAENDARTPGVQSAIHSPAGITARTVVPAGGSASPANNRSKRRMSSTVQAITPTLSSVGDSARKSLRPYRLWLARNPTQPLNAAGTRTEPEVSVPTASGAIPTATATAAPEEDPPGTRPGSSGLTGVPKCRLMPSPENANSLRLVLPTVTTPRSSTRRTRALSAAAGGRSLSDDDPHVVTVPATSKTSFQTIGTPSSGLRSAPVRRRSSLRSASRRARCAVTVIIVDRATGTWVRARACSQRSRALW
jgi:hypothetical protein